MFSFEICDLSVQGIGPTHPHLYGDTLDTGSCRPVVVTCVAQPELRVEGGVLYGHSPYWT
jgi:hypothetical protein